MENGQISSSYTHMAADRGHSAAGSTAHMTDTKTENMNEQSHQRTSEAPALSALTSFPADLIIIILLQKH